MKITSNAVKGFTLIEMMMTLSIAAILLTVAVPSYNTFTKNSKLTKQLNLLAASVSMARGEAAKRSARVVMCQSSDPTDSNTYCSGGWSNGWIVFVDADNENDYDAGEVVISIYQPESGVNIKTTTGAYLAFNPDGTTTSGQQTFTVCDDRGATYGKELEIAGTGRPSTGTPDDCTP